METPMQASPLPTWQYLPRIENGEAIQRTGDVRVQRVAFYANLRSSGMVQYRHLAATAMSLVAKEFPDSNLVWLS